MSAVSASVLKERILVVNTLAHLKRSEHVNREKHSGSPDLSQGQYAGSVEGQSPSGTWDISKMVLEMLLKCVWYCDMFLTDRQMDG